jgi:hypothetical protein
MPKPQVSVVKRQREQAKRERKQMKAEKRAQRKIEKQDGTEPDVSGDEVFASDLEEVVRETPEETAEESRK